MGRIGVIAALGAALLLSAQARAQTTAALSPADQAKTTPRVAMLGSRDCAVPLRIGRLDGPPLHALASLRREEGFKIVALGSSSTQGIGATNPDNSFPHQLQLMLERRFPTSTVRVVNKGIGGQLARDMLARLQEDVIDQRPDLVIWQTGTNDVTAGVAPHDFVEVLRKGVAELRDAGIDVLIVTPQYTPRNATSDADATYAQVFNGLAGDLGVTVFHRRAVMQQWVDSGRFSFATMLAADRFHMNDNGYRCWASVLADAIEYAAWQ